MKIDKVQLEVRLALLEKTNKILVWIAGALLTIVVPLASYIMNSSNESTKYETKIEQLQLEVKTITDALNLTNEDLGILQTWVEENYVTKDVFDATKKSN